MQLYIRDDLKHTLHSLGHSLGGSLASLIGATFGPPVVAFEAPGEKVAAARLHLPSPVSLKCNLELISDLFNLISVYVN